MAIKRFVIAMLICFSAAHAQSTESIETSQVQEENNVFKKLVKIFFPCFSHQEPIDPPPIKREPSEVKESRISAPRRSVKSELQELIEQADTTIADQEQSDYHLESPSDTLQHPLEKQKERQLPEEFNNIVPPSDYQKGSSEETNIPDTPQSTITSNPFLSTVEMVTSFSTPLPTTTTNATFNQEVLEEKETESPQSNNHCASSVTSPNGSEEHQKGDEKSEHSAQEDLMVIPEENLTKITEEPVEETISLELTQEEQSLLEQIKNELSDLTTNSNEQSALQEIRKKYIEPLKETITDADYLSLKHYLDNSNLNLAQFVKVSVSLKAHITVALPEQPKPEGIFPLPEQLTIIKNNLTQTGNKLTENLVTRVSEQRQSASNEFQKMYAKIVKGPQK